MLRFQERKEKNEMKGFIRTRHGKVTDDDKCFAVRNEDIAFVETRVICLA